MKSKINPTNGEKPMSTEKNPTSSIHLDLFGPTVEFLTLPQEVDNDFCVLRGIIPPGVFVPLHSHADAEDFVVISGEVQALKHVSGSYEWIAGRAGDYFHVPGGASHAWRNVGSLPLVALIITTSRMGQFFQETGRPATGAPQPVTSEDLARFAAVSAAYGYWNATPKENAAIGIYFSF